MSEEEGGALSIIDQERRELSEAVRLDAHGIEPVPVADRDSTPLQQFWVWMGANLAPINWVLGTLGPIFGLSLVETVLVVVIGNIVGCALFGLFTTMGHRTGVNQMVLSRSAFGRRGAYVPSAAQLLLTMGWIGVNTWVVLDLVVGKEGILDQLGYHGGQGTRYLVGLVIMLVQVLIAIWGFYLIRTFEKYTVPVTAAIMVAMTALAFTKVDVKWGGSAVHGSDKLSAMAALMTAIGIGWGISWLTMSSDYPRFVNPKYTAKQVFWATSLGMFIPTVWLAILGAAIATGGGGTDPSQLVAAAFGAMAIPVLFVVLHGPIATNILNIYSCSLAFLSLGLKVARPVVAAVAGVIGTVVLIAFVESSSFAHSFDNWMVSIVVWISPWAGITLIEYFVVRRGQIDVPALYDPPERSKYGDVNVAALVALALGLVAGWAWEYGLVDFMQGPIAKATGNTDLSWAAGMLVGGAIYYVLGGAKLRQPVTAPTAT
jgi:nucleobase:cation symporter-1, NCS1 family